ncbi:beta-phosphoglucomutase [Vibrio sp. HA2012]|uniref:beta-phosphoglucomutase n=1 Tax=Vibrio sp. HA2012 TaxID=1971595 RepID=UPI000C2C6420|nr:beta-phosphoglucomutase [Vibrio sp. HA2012]PJC87209.1 beta-phosphoglucomutase [Vibrio sp. HA2012]
MKNTYIFDLDGVIVDTARYHYLAWKKIADELDIFFDEALNESLKGVSRVECLEILIKYSGIALSDAEKADILSRKNDYYLDFIAQLTHSDLLPGVKALLDRCKDDGIYICLGSASKNAEYILDKLNIKHYFDVIVDGNHVTKAKPDPEVFCRASEALNVPYENCIVFEDSIAGITAAKNAGMYTVGIGSKDVLTEADIVFSDLSDFAV